MTTIYNLKPKFQSVLRPLTRTLAQLRLTLNQVTMAVLPVSVTTRSLITFMWEERLPLLFLSLILFVPMELNPIGATPTREVVIQGKLLGTRNDVGDFIFYKVLHLLSIQHRRRIM